MHRTLNGKIIARSMGWRAGKRDAKEGKSEYMPDFSIVFVPELVPEAERGYAEGWHFGRTGVKRSLVT